MLLTIRKCLNRFDEAYPDNDLTEYALRRLVSEGKVKHVKSGRKILVNYLDLLECLGGKK